jgi:hypothetical protein
MMNISNFNYFRGAILILIILLTSYFNSYLGLVITIISIAFYLYLNDVYNDQENFSPQPAIESSNDGENAYLKINMLNQTEKMLRAKEMIKSEESNKLMVINQRNYDVKPSEP